MIKINDPENCQPTSEKCCPPPCPPPPPIIPFIGVRSVNGKTGDVVLDDLTIGTKTYNGSQDITITASDLDLNTTFKYRGEANKYYIESLITPELGDVYFCKDDNLYYLNIGQGSWKYFASKDYVDTKVGGSLGVLSKPLTTELAIGAVNSGETFPTGTPIEHIIRRMFVPVLTSLTIASPPTKTSYAIGDTLDLSGMTIMGNYSLGLPKVITNYTTIPENGAVLTAATTSIIITYENLTCILPITVKALDHIAVTTPPTKVNYNEGEYFNPVGMVVTGYYTDSSTRIIPITEYSYTPETQLTILDTTITINHRGYSCTLDITVEPLIPPDYLCFTATEANTTVQLEIEGDTDIPAFSTLRLFWYSVDKITWNPIRLLALGDKSAVITLTNIGDKIYFRGINDSLGKMLYDPESKSNNFLFCHFLTTGKFNTSGNINTLLTYTGTVTIVPECAFYGLFYNNTSMYSLPLLPATILGKYCYSHMFNGCSNVKSTITLPATTLAESCYAYMFAYCYEMETIPLPATTLARCCYDGMHYETYMVPDCTNIDFTNPLTVASGGLIGLFAASYIDNSDLKDILPINPVTNNIYLPVTTLTEYCYAKMFKDCIYLTSTPELPATTLVPHCYENMFFGCSDLLIVRPLLATILSEYCYDGMFMKCTSLTEMPELPATTLAPYCYASMFAYCEALTEQPILPATILAEGCYTSMFLKCSNLVNAPVLSVTVLSNNCYSYMFANCTKLTGAPVLPATILTNSCYAYMFSGCFSLVNAPELPATTLADRCYLNMFGGCRSLITAPELPATTLTNTCYCGMFSGCSALINASVLPAPVATDSCYSMMFWNCTSLVIPPELPATTLADSCYYGMFLSCSSLRMTPTLPATTLAKMCYLEMFAYCTNLVFIPELPATALAEDSYFWMFKGCTKLYVSDTTRVESSKAWTIPTDTVGSGDYIMEDMFTNCLGIRSSNSPNFNGIQKTYYTLNVPADPDLSSILVVTAPTKVSYNVGDTLDLTGITIKATYKDSSIVDITSQCGFYPANGSILDDNTVTAVQVIFGGKTCNLPITITYIPDYFCFTANTAESTIKLPARAWTSLETSTDKETWTPYTANSTITLSNIGDKLYWRGINSGAITGYNTTGFVLSGSLTVSGNINTLLSYTNVIKSLDNRFCCFNGLFTHCSALTDASLLVLPATTLDTLCYSWMFGDCTNLVLGPLLPARNLAGSCYSLMFMGCTKLTEAPALPATVLAQACYNFMFYNCTSLDSAPALPATTLALTCYYGMFNGCTNLTYIPALPAVNLKTQCYREMFSGCTSLYVADNSGTEYDKAWTIPANGSIATTVQYASNSMFSGCLGTRSSDTPAFNAGGSYTYYTQNTPIS